METRQRGIEGPGRFVELTDELRQALVRDPSAAAALGIRTFGVGVTDHRSSWVRRGELAGIEVFVKTYDYPHLTDRLRGALRTTWLRAGRARREAAALAFLAAAGLPGPRALAVVEWRRLGWLRRSVLVTEAWPGQSLPEVFAAADDADRERLRAAARELARRLHALGFVDRNLDPRNLLVARRPDGSLELAKIDSPRFRLLAAGRKRDRLCALDRQRLERGLAGLR